MKKHGRGAKRPPVARIRTHTLPEGMAPLPPLHLLRHDALGALEIAARTHARTEAQHLRLMRSQGKDPEAPPFNPYAAARIVRSFLEQALEEAIYATGAARGNVQLLDTSQGALRIVVQRGFGPAFLRHFASVRKDSSACGAAWTAGRRIQVEDVADSPLFDARSVEVLLDARARSVISSPLLSREGRTMGILSVHNECPRTLPGRESDHLDRIVRRISDRVERLMTLFMSLRRP
jgi:hypothetical protein